MRFYGKSYLLLLLLLFSSAKGWAHIPKYATVTPSSSTLQTTGFPFYISINGVNNKDNAAGTDNTASSYANIFSYYGDAWLQVKYPNILDAGTTSFIRIDVPGYNLSSLIGDIITVDAYNNATNASNGALVSSPSISIVQDQNHTYLAITPSTQYNSLRINLLVQNLQFTPYSVRIYNSFYNLSDGADCGKGWAANIGEKSMGAAPASTVQNPVFVVDASTTTSSTLRLTTNQQNLEVSQTIYFSSTSYLSNVIKLRASVSSVYDYSKYTITAQAYHGLTAVGSLHNITSQVNATVNNEVDLYLNPGSYIDRVKVTIKANNNGNQAAHVNLHDVQLVPLPPTFIQSSISSCAGSITLELNNPDPGFVYKWYDTNDNPILNTSASYTTNFSYAATPYTIKVTATKAGCTSESLKANAVITINPKPATPVIVAN